MTISSRGWLINMQQHSTSDEIVCHNAFYLLAQQASHIQIAPITFTSSKMQPHGSGRICHDDDEWKGRRTNCTHNRPTFNWNWWNAFVITRNLHSFSFVPPLSLFHYCRVVVSILTPSFVCLDFIGVEKIHRIPNHKYTFNEHMCRIV